MLRSFVYWTKFISPLTSYRRFNGSPLLSLKIVIAVVNGELLVKRLKIEGKQLYLVAEHPNYPELKITEAMDFQIWGVVTNVIHPV